jgi:hypothetical protein
MAKKIKVKLILSSKLGEKSTSPRNGTGYYPHFVEYSRILLCVMFKRIEPLWTNLHYLTVAKQLLARAPYSHARVSGLIT